MNNIVLKNIIRFIVLVLIQVFVLNNIRINGYVNPYIYVMFILLLPFETPGWLLLISSFALGLSVDIFSNTPGMNAAAAVLMAFCRPVVIRLLSGTKGIEAGEQPGIADMGFRWFFLYSFILIFIHHLILFYIEIFRFNELIDTFYRVIMSTTASLVLIIIIQYLFMQKDKKE